MQSWPKAGGVQKIVAHDFRYQRKRTGLLVIRHRCQAIDHVGESLIRRECSQRLGAYALGRFDRGVPVNV